MHGRSSHSGTVTVPGVSLFRQEVMKGHRGEWVGFIVIVAASMPRWLLASFAAARSLAILPSLVFGHITGRMTVDGQPESSAGPMNVAVPGTVSKLPLHDGQEGEAGGVLPEFSGDRHGAAWSSVPTRADSIPIFVRSSADCFGRAVIICAAADEYLAQPNHIALLQEQWG